MANSISSAAIETKAEVSNVVDPLTTELRKKTQNLNNPYILYIVYVNVALYALCFQIQRPLEPFLVEKLLKSSGDSSAAVQEYAQLQSFFSLIQTFGSLISGRMLDYFGPKGGFFVNFAASALSYYLLSISTTLPILYASKLPTIFQAGFLCAQLTASQVTSDPRDRVKALGMLTMSYTVGSILGPTLGGFLGASGDYYYGARLAVVGSIISFVLTFFLPNKIIQAEEENIDASTEKTTASKDLPSYLSVIKVVWLFLATKVISSVANAMAAAVYPLVLKNEFGLGEKGVGISMSVGSACNALASGIFLEQIVRLLGGDKGTSDMSSVISNCLISMIGGSLVQGFVSYPAIRALSYTGDGMYEFIGVGLFLSVAQYVLATTITSESTSKVGPNAKGTLLGLEHALFAAARVVAPQIGIFILNSGGTSSVCIACLLVYAFTFILWNARSKKSTDSDDSIVYERKEK